MAATERSLLGFAPQTAKGTPNVTDADFKYILFGQGTAGVQNTIVPLDPEIGGGALPRDVVKAGAVAVGQLEFIPRPDTLGFLLKGALGSVVSTEQVAVPGLYDHVFSLSPDATEQFDAPYWTVRYAPGALWGEQYQDARFNALALNWRAANFVRGAFGFLGGIPGKVATTTWAAAPDNTPPFITPTATIEVPTGTAMKVLSGSFSAGMAIPLDQQWIVGSYFPDDFDITQKTFAIQLVVKITSDDPYTKMMYDPAGGSAWLAKIMREARINIHFHANYPAITNGEYGLKIEANGEAGDAGNVVWSAQPITVRPSQQVVMAITGVFLNDNVTSPVKVTLTNTVESY